MSEGEQGAGRHRLGGRAPERQSTNVGFRETPEGGEFFCRDTGKRLLEATRRGLHPYCKEDREGHCITWGRLHEIRERLQGDGTGIEQESRERAKG